MTTRRMKITRGMRARVFVAAEGKCFLCGLKIDAPKQKWEVDHWTPLWLGGADTEENMRPLHVHCHAGKSSNEAPVRAKSNRTRAKHIGLHKAKGRPMPGTKASGIRKRMNGTVERRR